MRKAEDTKALTFNFVLTLVSSLQKLANICKNMTFGSCWELLHGKLMSKQTHDKFMQQLKLHLDVQSILSESPRVTRQDIK